MPAPAQNRLEALGRGSSLRRKPPGGPTELTVRHHLLISYMIDGCQHPDLLARIKREKAVINDAGQPEIAILSPGVGEPLTLIEAADLLRIRRRNARELHGLPIFRKALNAAIDAYRNGERFASVRTMVEVRDDPGAGKAADRKVRLEASKALLGEDFSAGPTVNVNVDNRTQVRAGVVIRLPPGMPQTKLDPPGPVVDLRESNKIEASLPQEGERDDG